MDKKNTTIFSFLEACYQDMLSEIIYKCALEMCKVVCAERSV